MAAAVLLFQKYIAGWVVGLVSQENEVYILGYILSSQGPVHSSELENILTPPRTPRIE